MNDLASKANKFRIENGYGPTDPILLTSLLLKKNVITLFRPLSARIGGMAIKAPGDLRFMLINQGNNIGRQHFSIGHELFHLFIQANFSSQRCVTALFDKQTDLEERKADMFSAFLLLPKEGIIELLSDEERSGKNIIQPETIIKIQQYYSLSVNAVIFRLIELGYIDKSYFNLMEFGKKNLARKLGYSVDLYEPGNAGKNIGDYGLIVNELFKLGKISEAYYLELLNAINVDPFENTDNGNE